MLVESTTRERTKLLPSIQKLSDNRLVKSREAVIAFDEALASIPQVLPLKELKQLYLVFDDRCLHPEVMWGLIHCVESFDAERRLVAFVGTMPQLVTQAKDWAIILIVRTLKQEGNREIFQSILANADLVSYQEIEGLLKILVEEKEEPLASYASSLLHK